MTSLFRNKFAALTPFAWIPLCCLFGDVAAAQNACFPPSYRLETQTVYERQTVQRLRPVYRTEYVEQPVTSLRPVTKTKTEMREYRVAKPVTETSYREERYTVWKPVTETTYRDETYTETQYVTETAEREEEYTTYRPVTETNFVERQYAVQKPVTETSYVEQQYAVQRPVVETQYQTQQYTTLRPQTTVYNKTVDAGGYVPQTTVTPGQVGYGLQYKRDLYAVPGPLGIFARVRGGNVVAPYYKPPTAQTQMVYRPNYIQQQVAETSYEPVTEQVQVPVQVQRMQTEYVTQKVPVQRTRMETEYRTEKVPVQTTRMVPTTVVRKVPYVVERPVTETKTRRVPITQQKWVTEEKVRRIPVQKTRMTYETRRVPQTVQYTEYEEVTQMVRRPVVRKVYEPYTETRVVPRQTVQRIPMSYYDAFSPAIVSGYSSFADPVIESPSTMESSSTIVEPSDDRQESLRPSLEDEDEFDSVPKTGLKDVEFSSPDDNPSGSSNGDSGDLELNPAGDSLDNSDLPSPSDADVLDAGWKIQWNPKYEREI